MNDQERPEDNPDEQIEGDPEKPQQQGEQVHPGGEAASAPGPGDGETDSPQGEADGTDEPSEQEGSGESDPDDADGDGLGADEVTELMGDEPKGESRRDETGTEPDQEGQNEEVPVWELEEEPPPADLEEENEQPSGHPQEDDRVAKLERLKRKNRKKQGETVPRAVVEAVKERVKQLEGELSVREDRIKELEEAERAREEQFESLEEERDEIQERLLRVAADLENFRRRSEREKEELKKYGIDKVVLELIPAVDNLERALEHAQVRADEGSASFIDGVRMVYRQILEGLKKYGVRGFESVGDRFDPERHEAIQQVETDEYDTGVVVEQFQKGYFLHERLLRPALVSVAKRVESTEDVESADEGTEGDSDGTDGEVGPAPTGASSSERQSDTQGQRDSLRHDGEEGQNSSPSEQQDREETQSLGDESSGDEGDGRPPSN